MLPQMTDDVVGHHGLHAVGQISGHPWPPTGIRREQCSVDGDRKVFLVNYIPDSPQAILPTLRNSRGIERRDVELNAGGRQIDAHPMDQAVALLGCFQPLATVSNSLEYFGGS